MSKANKEKETVPAVVETAGAVVSYGGYDSTGFENTTKDDFQIPFIKVLQQMSPECKPIKQGGLPGAEPGKIINSVTQEMIDGEKGIEFVPATTNTCYIEWKPREAGGGFVGMHAVDSDIVAEAIKRNGGNAFGKLATKDGNELIHTFNIFALLCEGEQPLGMAILSATSTKIKAYKKLLAKLRAHQVDAGGGRRVNPPLFANRVRMTTRLEKNNKGEFYNIAFTSAVENDLKKSLLPPGHILMDEAYKFGKLVNEGKAKADFSTQTQGSADVATTDDEEIPF